MISGLGRRTYIRRSIRQTTCSSAKGSAVFNLFRASHCVRKRPRQLLLLFQFLSLSSFLSFFFLCFSFSSLLAMTSTVCRSTTRAGAPGSPFFFLVGATSVMVDGRTGIYTLSKYGGSSRGTAFWKWNSSYVLLKLVFFLFSSFVSPWSSNEMRLLVWSWRFDTLMKWNADEQSGMVSKETKDQDGNVAKESMVTHGQKAENEGDDVGISFFYSMPILFSLVPSLCEKPGWRLLCLGRNKPK